jgi:indole-3-glycerol phosphate synthase / phosphoribosylanthranilate isomerase
MNDIENLLAKKKIEIAIKLRQNPLKNFVEYLNQSKRNFKESIKKKTYIKKITSLEKFLKKSSDVVYIDLEEMKSFNNYDNVPILLKDLIIDEYQIFEARFFDFDALILLKKLFSKEEINKFVLTAKILKMDVILEVDTIEEMYDAMFTDAEIIAINNWDNEKKEYDLRKTIIFNKLNREKKIIISDGGIEREEEMKLISNVADAVII